MPGRSEPGASIGLAQHKVDESLQRRCQALVPVKHQMVFPREAFLRRSQGPQASIGERVLRHPLGQAREKAVGTVVLFGTLSARPLVLALVLFAWLVIGGAAINRWVPDLLALL